MVHRLVQKVSVEESPRSGGLNLARPFRECVKTRSFKSHIVKLSKLPLQLAIETRPPLSFTPGFNRVIRPTKVSTNRFNGLSSRPGNQKPLKRFQNQKNSSVTRLKPGVNERGTLHCLADAFLEFAVARGANRQTLIEQSRLRLEDLTERDNRLPLATKSLDIYLK